MPDIVTRFAPSPTGFLHIGGARTALFNWLFARHHGGKMLLRIEDTDRARSTDEAIDAITKGLSWLGLDWDGDTVFQSQRLERHSAIAHELVEKGHAYRCYATPEELNAMREKARAEKRPPRYDGRWRDRPASDAPAGIDPVIRIKTPEDGVTVVDDAVQGRVEFPNKDLDDFVILRSDGTPTYMLSVIVDDHDMGVTNIIRGDDHFTNAARQTQVFNAMEWDVPNMAHIPLIHGPDGAKLSKRHGALGVEAYRDMGYLPAGLRNYLVRLGWAHGDQEVFSTDEMVALFDLDAVGKSPARFDFPKLENLNGHYIRSADNATLVQSIVEILPKIDRPAGIPAQLSGSERDMLLRAMDGLKERAKTLTELIASAQFLFAKRPLSFDEKAEKQLSDDARAMLKPLHESLEALPSWDHDSLDQAVRSFAESQELKLGKVAQPLRAALTGGTTSPGIFDVLEVLGRDEVLGRLADVTKT
ncbi:MAG: glutamate--tRNA ligase [Pseudomonadota bacterium]